jgi:hypothetical protein
MGRIGDEPQGHLGAVPYADTNVRVQQIGQVAVHGYVDMSTLIGLEHIGCEVITPSMALAPTQIDDHSHECLPRRIGNRSTVRTPGVKTRSVARLTE